VLLVAARWQLQVGARELQNDPMVNKATEITSGVLGCSLISLRCCFPGSNIGITVPIYWPFYTLQAATRDRKYHCPLA
jgi:hypothetical protein